MDCLSFEEKGPKALFFCSEYVYTVVVHLRQEIDMNLTMFKNEMNAAANIFDDQFKAEHNDCLDFGACGHAVVLVSFGRKRKIKQEFEDAGLLGMTWTSGGKKEYVVEIPRGTVPTQNYGYYAGRAEMIAKLLRGYVEPEGVGVRAHSWID